MNKDCVTKAARHFFNIAKLESFPWISLSALNLLKHIIFAQEMLITKGDENSSLDSQMNIFQDFVQYFQRLNLNNPNILIEYENLVYYPIPKKVYDSKNYIE